MKKNALIVVISLFMGFGSYLGAQTTDFSLSSPVIKGPIEKGFSSGLEALGRLPVEFGAKPGKVNPRNFPFTWSGLPGGTKALCVIFDDPDAKPVIQFYGGKDETFLHWLAADIDPALGGLGDNAAAKASFPQGLNGNKKPAYMSPAPPSNIPKDFKGKLIHVYRLKVFALSAPTGLKTGFTLAELEKAMEGKILGTSQLNLSYINE